MELQRISSPIKYIAGTMSHEIATILTALGFFNGPGTYTKQPGEGVARAQARLRTKLKANEAIPSGERYTRQQDRAEKRRHAKSMRTLRKNRAMQASYPGGAAEERELFL